jgi:hypothetical protein
LSNINKEKDATCLLTKFLLTASISSLVWGQFQFLGLRMCSSPQATRVEGEAVVAQVGGDHRLRLPHLGIRADGLLAMLTKDRQTE